jgi:hypothetical protein
VLDVLVARSSPECHLYIELHPCACGEAQYSSKHRLVSRDDQLVAVYEGTCPRCHVGRGFEFALDPEIPPGMKFGGAKPSQIIDAAQFLAVADAAARSVPGDAAALSSDDRSRARVLMSRAVDALEEVLKFIPSGAEQVSASVLFTADGQAIYAREPGRFRKNRLEAVLGVYRELLAKL